MEPKIIRSKLEQADKEALLKEAGDMIKVAVDTERNILSAGGDLHVDCYAQLLEDDSDPAHVWGANYYPASGQVDFISMVNIRPSQNRSMEIEDKEIRTAVEQVIRNFFEP